MGATKHDPHVTARSQTGKIFLSGPANRADLERSGKGLTECDKMFQLISAGRRGLRLGSHLPSPPEQMSNHYPGQDDESRKKLQTSTTVNVLGKDQHLPERASKQHEQGYRQAAEQESVVSADKSHRVRGLPDGRRQLTITP